MYTALIILLLASFKSDVGDRTFPEVGEAYRLNFGEDLAAKVVFISDSEMVYGNEGERGDLCKVTIAKVSTDQYSVKWKSGPFETMSIEHRYDLSTAVVTSHVLVCNGKEFDLKGTFRKVQ